MMFDGGLEIDIDAVNHTIDEAQIISLFFPLLRKTLLLDTRTDGDVGPFVRVGSSSVIGQGSELHAGVYVGRDVRIGRDRGALAQEDG